MAQIVRLHVDHPLGPGQPVPLTREQAHYLFGVMRLAVGDELRVFNGRDGGWRARVSEAGKKGGALECVALEVAQWGPPDLWLMFAPVKKARTDFIVEKAVEMGAARILPVLTEFTNSERVRVDRLQAHALEAAEQCAALVVPEVAEPERLGRVLDRWDPARRILFCDETLAGGVPGLMARLSDARDDATGRSPWAILIGPEGGFSDAERGRLARIEGALAVPLGPRILRADTAVVAALTLWQAMLGDWQ